MPALVKGRTPRGKPGELPWFKEHPPVADGLASTLFCVPIHHDLTEQQVAQIGEALRKVAAAYREYAAARTRAERLEKVRAKAEEAFRLIAENELNFTAAQRLIAQSAVAQARLEAAKARADAWRAASAISGLTLEEEWPVRVKPE